MLHFLLVFSLFSQDWERTKGPYDFPYIDEMCVFNNELFGFSSYEIFNLEIDKWEKTNLDFPTNEIIQYFKQKDNLVFIFSKEGKFISTDYGSSWVLTPKVSESGDDVGGLKNAEIIGNKIFISRPSANVPKCRIFEYDFVNNNWNRIKAADSDLDVIGNCFASYKNYIVSSTPYIFKRDSLINGTYYSSDYGTSWYKVDNLKYSFRALKFHNEILFGTGTDSLLYKSFDFGKTWEVDSTLKFAPDLYYSDGNNLFGSFYNDKYADESGIHISTDNGVSWEKRHFGLQTLGTRRILSYNGILYCIDDYKKMFESTDLGKTWRNSEIYTDSLQSYDLLFNKDTLFVGTSGTRGISYSAQEGTDWEILGGEKDYRFSRMHKLNKKDSVFVCVNLGDYSLNISSDYGNTWESVLIGINDFNYNFIKGVEFLGGDTILVVTIFGARYSTDTGKNWYKFSTENFKSDFYITNSARINENTLLIKVRNEGLFKSINNGQNWEKVETEFFTNIANPFETFRYLNGRIYAFIPNLGLYYSSDEGITWSELNSEMSEKGIDNGILYYDGNIILPTSSGIIISNDIGKTTKTYDIEQITKDTSTIIYIYDIEISNNYLFVASSKGIFRIKLSDIGIFPTSVESERNYLYTLPPYPLPSQNEVKVQFYWDINLPMTADDISVYDITGRKLITKDKIRLEKKADHYGNLIWDCSSEEPGIYLINIKHGTEDHTVKVVVE